MNRENIKLNRLIWGLGLVSIILIFSSIVSQENYYKDINNSNKSGNNISLGTPGNFLIITINQKLTNSFDKNLILTNLPIDTSAKGQNSLSRSEKNDTAGFAVRIQKNAKDLSVNLMKKLNLSLEQAADVRDALIDYQKDIHESRQKYISREKDNSNESDHKNEMTGSRDNLIKSYKDADKKANDKIEKTLNKDQARKYLDVKNSWWRDVKDRVYDREMSKSHRKLQEKKSTDNESDKDKDKDKK
jgi:hypothetical protein